MHGLQSYKQFKLVTYPFDLENGTQGQIQGHQIKAYVQLLTGAQQ